MARLHSVFSRRSHGLLKIEEIEFFEKILKNFWCSPLNFLEKSTFSVPLDDAIPPWRLQIVGDLLIITGKLEKFNRNKFGCIEKIPHKVLFDRIWVEMFERQGLPGSLERLSAN